MLSILKLFLKLFYFYNIGHFYLITKKSQWVISYANVNIIYSLKKKPFVYTYILKLSRKRCYVFQKMAFKVFYSIVKVSWINFIQKNCLVIVISYVN